MWLGHCCETVVPGRGLCCATSGVSVGEAVGRAFPVAAAVSIAVLTSLLSRLGCSQRWSWPEQNPLL